jgi:hypothetical protein
MNEANDQRFHAYVHQHWRDFIPPSTAPMVINKWPMTCEAVCVLRHILLVLSKYLFQLKLASHCDHTLISRSFDRAIKTEVTHDKT